MAFSTTTSSRFNSIPGGISLAPSSTDYCSHQLKSSLSISRRSTKLPKALIRKSKKKKIKRTRPSSAMQAAAEAAPISTSFGKSGRGEASHWNWVKSGKRPPKALSALEKHKNKTSKQKTNGFGGPIDTSTSDILTEAKLRKRLFQKPKFTSEFSRKPVDVENYICSHAHLGNRYHGSFGYREGKSSREGSFSKSGRNDQWRMPTAYTPAPNAYGDINPTFGKVHVNGSHFDKDKNNTDYVNNVLNGQNKNENSNGRHAYDTAVANLKDPKLGELYKHVVMKNSRRTLEDTTVTKFNQDTTTQEESNYLFIKLKQAGLIPNKETYGKAMLQSNQQMGQTRQLGQLGQLENIKTKIRPSSSPTRRSSSLPENKKELTKKQMLQKIKSLNSATLKSNFAKPGLGGTTDRFSHHVHGATGTFMPGPGQYGDVNSFTTPKARPKSAVAMLPSTKRPKGGTLHTQTSTFGCSLRGDLLTYQRRFGIGVGGEDSPGPAYALSKRGSMSFGGNITSSNVMIQQQEYYGRKQNELGDDPKVQIKNGLQIIKKRAQSATVRSPLNLQNVQNVPSRSNQNNRQSYLNKGLPPPSPFLNKRNRPVSAQSSPDVRRTFTRSRSSSCVSNPPSSSGIISKRKSVTIRDDRDRKNTSKKMNRRPMSASPSPKRTSPVRTRMMISPEQRSPDGRRRPASSKLIRSRSDSVRSTLLPVDKESDDEFEYYEDDFEDNAVRATNVQEYAKLSSTNALKENVENVENIVVPGKKKKKTKMSRKKRKERKKKLQEELQIALKGVEEAAARSRSAANRVLKTIK